MIIDDHVLYARVAMDTQFLDTVARMQAWARRMSSLDRWLEEHPGARRGTSESSLFLALYGGVVTTHSRYTLAYLDRITSCMLLRINFHSSKSSSMPSHCRCYLVRLLSGLLCIDTSHPCIYIIRSIPVYITISDCRQFPKEPHHPLPKVFLKPTMHMVSEG
jgi:hypothetical protein